jgi:hypothetical protein
MLPVVPRVVDGQLALVEQVALSLHKLEQQQQMVQEVVMVRLEQVVAKMQPTMELVMGISQVLLVQIIITAVAVAVEFLHMQAVRLLGIWMAAVEVLAAEVTEQFKGVGAQVFLLDIQQMAQMQSVH